MAEIFMKKVNCLPKVCICIPAYNAEATIGETLKSLVNQTYKNISIYVIDNNSKDKTVKVVEKFVKKYEIIKLFKYNNTVPADENFDRCITHADGEYTCIFHSDDVYLPNIIEKEIEFFTAHSDIGAVFTYANVINENGKKISELKSVKDIEEKKIYNFQELFPLYLKYGNFFVTPSAMIRTEIYKKEIVKHKRQENFSDAFDVDVWLRILSKHKVGFIYDKLMNYRLSIHSTSFRKLLLYKNTIEDGMFNVLECTMKEQGVNYLLNCDDYIGLKNRNMLGKVFKAYVSGDYVYARQLIRNIDISRSKKQLKFIKFIFEIMVLLPLPLFFRKILVYVKYRRILQGQFLKIKLS